MSILNIDNIQENGGHYGELGGYEYGAGGEYVGEEYGEHQPNHFQTQQGQFQVDHSFYARGSDPYNYKQMLPCSITLFVILLSEALLIRFKM